MEKWIFNSRLVLKQKELSYGVQQIICNHLLNNIIVHCTNDFIEFINTNHTESLIDIINNLEITQQKFDEMEKLENVELNELINTVNLIRDYEYYLIDEANTLLKIKKDIDNYLLEFDNQISDINYWE